MIVETRSFTVRIRELLSDEEYRLLQNALVGHPEAGTVMRGTGGLRKMRWQGSGRGKRGGIRVIYYWSPVPEQLLMLFAYPKSERDDLTANQRAALRKIVDSEYP